MIIDFDNTLSVNGEGLRSMFRSRRGEIKCEALPFSFHIDDTEISDHRFHDVLEDGLGAELDELDAVIVFTMTPYSNNYFYEGINKVYVVSLSGWNILTQCSLDKGIAYLVCTICIKYVLGVGENHDRNVGCVNDFLWDKTGIDTGMRAAYVCERCRTVNPEIISENAKVFEHLENVLDQISHSARRGSDLLSSSQNSSSDLESFDIFLCHNSKDKEAVRTLNDFLKNAGVSTWLDEEQIDIGGLWQDELEAAIEGVRACGIIVGDDGFGPWQDMERRAFIAEFLSRQTIIVPILIGNNDYPIPELPVLLRQFQFLDLRGDKFSNASKLVGLLKP